jgi:MGT family glycosyltransferase
VIAADPTFWAPMVVLYDKTPVQVAVCSFIPACTLPGSGAPPFGPGLARRSGVVAAATTSFLRMTMRLTSRVSRRAVNDLRAAHGLAPITVPPSEYTGAMPLYLVPASRRFDYDRQDLPASVHYVGPYLWNQPRTEASAAWLDELPRDRPCVHVTEGTVQVHRPFVLDAAIAGLGDLPMTVVATTGGRERATPQRSAAAIPANFRVVAWVSHAELMPRTDVMVTTGGAGSVLASLSAGVPLVIVPTEWDKPEIAQRVVEAGAGIRLAPQQCTPATLRDSVQRILAEPSFRANARRLAEEFAALRGETRAAELLVALSRTSRQLPHASAASHD